jgi:hypothetical protein
MISDMSVGAIGGGRIKRGEGAVMGVSSSVAVIG